MAERFIIQCPNEEFDGVRCGIRFDRGRAIVTDRAIRDILVNEYGYQEVVVEPRKGRES